MEVELAAVNRGVVSSSLTGATQKADSNFAIGFLALFRNDRHFVRKGEIPRILHVFYQLFDFWGGHNKYFVTFIRFHSTYIQSI